MKNLILIISFNLAMMGYAQMTSTHNFHNGTLIQEYTVNSLNNGNVITQNNWRFNENDLIIGSYLSPIDLEAIKTVAQTKHEIDRAIKITFINVVITELDENGGITDAYGKNGIICSYKINGNRTKFEYKAETSNGVEKFNSDVTTFNENNDYISFWIDTRHGKTLMTFHKNGKMVEIWRNGKTMLVSSPKSF